MDGQVTHLCMSVLKEGILEHLLKIYEQENNPKDSTAAKTGSSSEAGQRSSLLSVPHPSDQATPSSPRGCNTVDQLQSSLRQVADALAQTVAAVQNSQEHPVHGTGTRPQEMENEDGGEEEEVQFSEEPENPTLPPPPLPPPPPPPLPDQNVPPSSCVNLDPASLVLPITEDTLSGESDVMTTPTAIQPLTSHTTSSSAVSLPPGPPQTHSPSLETTTTTTTTVSSFSLPTPLFTQSTSVAQAQRSSTASTTTTAGVSAQAASNFDGSQESARAMLEQTDPQDPLYTFLSAYVGAPPPTSGSVGASSPATSGAHTTQSLQSTPLQSTPATSVPPPVSPTRLPVFTRMQSPSDPATVGSIPLSQPTMDLTRPPTATYHRLYPTSHISAPVTTAPSSSTAPLSTSQDIVSLAENIASQVTSFFQSNPLNALDSSAPSSAPSLEQAASLTSSLAQELSRTVSQLAPTSSSGEVGGANLFPQLMPTTSVAGQSSPSPSDTLAPLISSLQMPTLPVTTAAEEGTTTGTVSAPRVAGGTDRPTGGQATTSHARDGVVAEETVRVSVIAGRPWPEVGEIFEQGRVEGSEGSLEPVPSSTGNVCVSSTEAVTTQAGSTTVSAPTSGEQRSQDSAMEEGTTADTSSGVATATDSTASTVPPTLQQLPETIDEEFLAALPDHIQQEVLAQHAREQRARQARQEGFSTSISPEFLSALPPNIQEEVCVSIIHAQATI